MLYYTFVSGKFGKVSAVLIRRNDCIAQALHGSSPAKTLSCNVSKRDKDFDVKSVRRLGNLVEFIEDISLDECLRMWFFVLRLGGLLD